MGILGKIFEQYRQLNDRLKSFDFLSDDLDSHAFLQIQKSAGELDKLTNEFELDSQKTLAELKAEEVILTNIDRDYPAPNEEAAKSHSSEVHELETQKVQITKEMLIGFMNHTYSYKLLGFKKLANKLNPFVDRFFIYRKTIHSLHKVVGESYFGSESITIL